MVAATPTPPRGRDEIVEAVLAAAERLFAQAPPDEVSMRAVADEAGVTYSLVHRHLGSKADLVDELLRRSRARWSERVAEGSVSDALDALLGPTADSGPYLRLLAWAILDGEHRLGAHRTHWALDELVPRAGTELGISEAEAQQRLAAAVSLVLGWRFFARFVAEALGVDDADRGRIHAAVAAAAAAVVGDDRS